MRKGLISFILVLCTMVLLTTGCQSNSAETVLPTKQQNQTVPQQSSALETVVNEIDIVPETTIASETEGTMPIPDIPSKTEPTIQETEPDETKSPTKPPRETAPPVIEDPEFTVPNDTKPKPTEPSLTPTEPENTEPPVTEPVTEPVEVIDLDALVQYGLSYAANTYGYDVSRGVRDGYYPAYTCVFSTMEEGKAAIRGCVDDTTRALLAVPGTQIAVEINGVMCRARMDIVIVQQGNNRYLVNVYYG